MQQVSVKGQMSTIMSGSAAECLCAVVLIAAVTELVTIQTHQPSVVMHVMVHHVGVIAISPLDDTTPRTSQHLLVLVALPA